MNGFVRYTEISLTEGQKKQFLKVHLLPRALRIDDETAYAFARNEIAYVKFHFFHKFRFPLVKVPNGYGYRARLSAFGFRYKCYIRMEQTKIFLAETWKGIVVTLLSEAAIFGFYSAWKMIQKYLK